MSARPRVDISSTPLAETALATLRDDILSGRRPPGSPLAEKPLAAELRMSRTPVRAALATLQQEGLAEVGSRRQMAVARVTAESQVEVILLRVAIEAVVIRRLCELRADAALDLDQLDALRLLVFKQRRAAADEDVARFHVLDEQFHLEMAALSRLRTAHRYLVELRGFVRLLWLGLVTDVPHFEEVVRQHEQLIDAIEAGDAETAAGLVTYHIRSRAARGSRALA